MQKKILFFITSEFPYGKSEAFIENEYPYLVKSFDEIHIISNTKPSVDPRTIDSSTTLSYMRYLPNFMEKVIAFAYIINPTVQQEIKNLKSFGLRIFKKGILSTIVSSFYTGKRLKKHISKYIKEKQLHNERIVLYSYWCNDMSVGLAIIKNDFPEIKTVCRAHGYDIYFERNKIEYLPFRNLIFSVLDQVHFVSNHGFQYASNKIGRYNSMQVSFLGTKRVEAQNYHTTQVKRLVSCSSLIPVKRVHLIIQALSRIENIEIKWVHLGGGPELKSIMELAETLLDHKKNINYDVIGTVTNKEVLETLRKGSFDFFINVSESEGMPVSIMEALSFGIPIIATSVGGIPEFINDSNGYLLSKNPSPSEVSIKLTRLLLNNTLEQMSKKALETWERYFDAEYNYQKYVESITS